MTLLDCIVFNKNHVINNAAETKPIFCNVIMRYLKSK